MGTAIEFRVSVRGTEKTKVVELNVMGIYDKNFWSFT